MHYFKSAITILLLTLRYYVQAGEKSISVQNNCGNTVTVGVLTNGQSSGSAEQSFDLTPGSSNSFTQPDSWGGRVWGRYYCSGSAGKDVSQCGTPGATNPASLAEFFFKGAGGMDFYDLSLVDGFNLPMVIAPQGGGAANGYECGSPSCSLSSCPDNLAVKDATGNVMSCLSACSKTGSPQDCCTGAYATPDACKASGSSNSVKEACPDAYSYAYDDKTSTYQCDADGYSVTFC